MAKQTLPAEAAGVDGRSLPRIVGRSSSHFTRVVRMFAAEVEVAYEFQVVPSLVSQDAASYGDNPGLRLPNLVTDDGVVFGSLGSCRALASLATAPRHIVWPETTPTGVAANALELTLQAMSTEVTLVMLNSSDSQPLPYADKLRAALTGMLVWLDTNVEAAFAALPERQVSYLEVTLFCLMEHLEFRNLMPVDGYDRLIRFRDAFGERASAKATGYRFDS